MLNDLTGDKRNKYKLRLGCKETNTQNDTYYEFLLWIRTDCNIEHRLKYVTNTIVKNLEKSGENQFNDKKLISLTEVKIPYKEDRPTFKISSNLFNDYHMKTHLQFVARNKADDDQDKDLKQSANLMISNVYFKRYEFKESLKYYNKYKEIDGTINKNVMSK